MEDKETTASQSISKLIANAVRTFLQIFTDIFNLALLEAQLAVKSLIVLVGLMLFSVLLIAFTWFGFMGALVLWFIALGLNSSYAFLLVGILNLLGFVAILFIAKLQWKNLRFQATRMHIIDKVGLNKER
jgi:hypothetical protein